jgi:hypothetical protein
MRQIGPFLFLLGILVVWGPAHAEPDADLKKAIALFKATFEGRCANNAFTTGYLEGTESQSFSYRLSDKADAKEYKATLYTFFCDHLHNAGTAAFIIKEDDETFRVLSFAMPSSKWVDDAKAPDGRRFDGLEGFVTSDTLDNGEFRLEEMTIVSAHHDFIGDTYLQYKFISGSFQFVEDERYEIKNGKLELKPPSTEEDQE